MHDLVVEGGTIVTATESYEGDIGIIDGSIQTLGRNLKGKQRIDASGKLVMPGGFERTGLLRKEGQTGGLRKVIIFSGMFAGR